MKRYIVVGVTGTVIAEHRWHWRARFTAWRTGGRVVDRFEQVTL